ncbi:caspase domain-containing protein [Cryptosporangium sp. NPDC051539]|uniref:caspase domain-containing protein n=1 Tax=Cryptosporangium sp. NPDC051539 TaxID=3363962 RepID=UPI00378BEBF2
MRKALIVGIDHYKYLPELHGCVKDAHSVRGALEEHATGEPNFVSPRMITASAPSSVTRDHLRDAVEELFTDDPEIALFYFAGHGWFDDTGGFLSASDCRSGHDGVALNEVMTFANNSPAQNKVIILDCCHSGTVADVPLRRGMAEVSTGTTILTASTDRQYSVGTRRGGVFTNLLVDALGGSAANLVGEITPGSVYAHIDQSLGPWAQRPVFKTNVKRFVSLKRVRPPITRNDLKALVTLFPAPGHRFALDPSFEPERSSDQKADVSIPPPDPAHTATFAVLQNYAKVNLLRPVDAPHLWHAAMWSKSCELTVLGQHYWQLVNDKLI